MGVKLAIAGFAAVILIPLLIVAVLGQAVSSLVGGGGGDTSQPSSSALADIPGDYLALYRAAAATCPGLDWSVLAAIGKVETDHGRSQLPGVHSGHNGAGAEGPMQFLPSTFVSYDQPVPPGGATPPSPYDPVDAIYAAARLLCANGARNNANIHAAIFAYNHADWYVSEVLTQAAQYASAQAAGTNTSAGPAALAAINYAQGQLGLPYEWGGSGPAAGDTGFDCSGLTQAAYAAAGISLPHNADAQYRQGPAVPAGAPLLPGDLVFYGTQQHLHHVGLYVGNGLMIDAPDVHKNVQLVPYRYPGDDYLGATRPAGLFATQQQRAAR